MQVSILIKHIAYLAALAGLLALLSCQRKSNFFFVENEGAIMPVQVGGNTDSGVFVVLLPGGPAGDGLLYRKVFPMFRKRLEQWYAMVYYDQRGAGNCRGMYERNTLHLSQLGADLDQLIAAIQREYPDPKIFLLGYSYGGALGGSYLLERQNNTDVAGFISIAGAFDRREQQRQQNQLVQYGLESWQAKGYIESYDMLRTGFRCTDQEDVLQCRRDSVAIQQEVSRRLADIERYNRFPVNAGSIARLLNFAFFSQSNPLISSKNETLHAKYFQPEFDSLYLSDQAVNITTPVLLINGRWDTNVPFFTAQNMYDRIGTPNDQKSLLILEESGHLPMITEPEELSRGIIAFIESRQAAFQGLIAPAN